jgi:hypothetical protein
MSEWKDGDDSALYDDGYADGVRDAVALINENEDMELNWRDVMNALTIKKLIEGIDSDEDN